MTSREVEQLLGQAQVYQQQIQAILTQKGAFKLETDEIKKALDELEKSKSTTAYKVSGPVLIKNDVKTIKKELKERLDFLDLKMKSIEKQETMMKSKIEGLRDKLTEAEKPSAGGS